MHKLSLFVMVLACVCSGCTLDDVVFHGTQKCDADYILTPDGKCLVSGDNEGLECGGYIESVKMGFCPKDYDVCAADKSGKSYCHLKCSSAQVFCNENCIDPNTSMRFCGAKGDCLSSDPNSEDYAGAECTGNSVCQNGVCTSMDGCTLDQYTDTNGECQENTMENCGANGYSCYDAGVLVGECRKGACYAESCMKEYHLNNGRCVHDSTSCCGENCSQCNSGEACKDGSCIHIEGCNDDEHKESGSCVPNTVEACGAVNCTKNAGWKDGICNVNQCEASSCEDNYHLNADIKRCDADSTTCCGNECADCGENACISGRCITLENCKPNQHNSSSDGACVDNTEEACGTVNCKTLPGWAGGDCNVNQCEAATCDSGYHLNGTVCEADRSACCGSSCADCGDNACINGSCQAVESCKQNQHNDSATGACVDNTEEACGTVNCTKNPGWDGGICNIDQCEASKCKDGYHLKNKVCEADSSECCGPNCIKCSENEICNNAACLLNKCEEGKSLCGSGSNLTCRNILTDMKNCGGCDVECTPRANAEPSACKNKKCVFQCTNGYKQCGTETEPDCRDTMNNNANCGACNNKCESTEYCSGGKCLPTTCASGTHKNSAGECIADSKEECGPSKTNCTTSFKNATATECKNATCEITQCTSGFHPNSAKNYCDSDSPEACGSATNNCRSIPNQQSVSCTSGKCVVNTCATGKHPNSTKTACEDDSPSVCGNSRKNCSTSGAVTVSCDSGVCHVSKCSANLHPNSAKNACDSDTIEACGSATNNCRSIPDQQSVSCTSGKCVVNSCATGKHPNSAKTACESDTNERCGNNGDNCSSKNTTSTTYQCSNGKCVFSCAQGYHKSENACVADSVTACGPSAIDCKSTTGWRAGGCYKGACIPIACSANHHIVIKNGTVKCEQDLPSACGGTRVCNLASPGASSNSAVTCTNGKCEIKTSSGSTYNWNRTDYRAKVVNNKVVWDVDLHTDVIGGYQSCATREHFTMIAGAKCEQDTVSDCGWAEYECAANVVGWATGECIADPYYSKTSVCSVTTCSDGFKPVNVSANSLVKRCEPTFSVE